MLKIFRFKEISNNGNVFCGRNTPWGTRNVQETGHKDSEPCSYLRSTIGATDFGQRKVLGKPQYKKQKWICSSWKETEEEESPALLTHLPSSPGREEMNPGRTEVTKGSDTVHSTASAGSSPQAAPFLSDPPPALLQPFSCHPSVVHSEWEKVWPRAPTLTPFPAVTLL